MNLDRATEWFEGRRASYEKLVDAIAEYVPTAGTVLDVGANIGYFTKTLVERTGFVGTVHLFEPVPNLADLCEQAVARLPCTATVHRIGLSDENTRLEIFVSSDGNLGWNTIVAEKAHGKGMVPVEIKVARFDGLGLAERPDLIKIDVEGAEYRVLSGMLPALAAWSPRPVILCEIGWGADHPAWAQELEILDQLVALGYRPVDVGGAEVELRALRSTTDVVFLPRP